jgi:hypothetical protein
MKGRENADFAVGSGAWAFSTRFRLAALPGAGVDYELFKSIGWTQFKLPEIILSSCFFRTIPTVLYFRLDCLGIGQRMTGPIH